MCLLLKVQILSVMSCSSFFFTFCIYCTEELFVYGLQWSSFQDQPNSKYSSLSDGERKQIEEILYLLDKFCVGDSFYHELTMVTGELPKSYLIQQCRGDLNKLCHIDSLLLSILWFFGNTLGAKVHCLRDLIKEHVQECLKENPSFDFENETIQIKVSRDGARMTRNSSFVLFLSQSFKLVIM